jgi:hypothetical protein
VPEFSGHLQIDDADLDALRSALRRHDRVDAARMFERWATSENQTDWTNDRCNDLDWPLLHLDHELTAWVHREASHHVAGGRFEHALCLVEAYRRPFKAADMKARITLPTGADR